jgi:hypothetical protein
MPTLVVKFRKRLLPSSKNKGKSLMEKTKKMPILLEEICSMQESEPLLPGCKVFEFFLFSIYSFCNKLN